KQVELAGQVAAKGLSVRETERLVQEATSAPKAGAKPGRKTGGLDGDARRLQEEIAEAVGARVTLKPGKGGKGSLVIDYASLEQLDGIAARL
ncbi:MAG TPA: chromosome partitioning protein ParB, partial [Usitatibacteraceae bacterium]|nr:chromosome partitioning protein ParB [Usitatibacteraceae bacterium]